MGIWPLDPVELAQSLIRCESVTPVEGGALTALEDWLQPLGFKAERMPFQDQNTPDVDNLFARIGSANAGRHLCFAGHTDVVPVGNPADWRDPPFAATIREGVLYGRGAVDMKGAIAAFVAAAAAYLSDINREPTGAISLLITGDEEGPSVNGTKKMLEVLAGRGERFDACIVGEPTNPAQMGEMIKIGRRGSLNALLTVRGVQGHVAYPERADNPIHGLLPLLNALADRPLDAGHPHFPASSLQLTSVDVGNLTTNLIPAKAEARFNVRFNANFDGKSLEAELRRRLDEVRRPYDLSVSVSGESFVTEPGQLTEIVANAVQAVSGSRPEFSTSGGTSDARFIKNYCPVVELGLISATAHQVDEHVLTQDIRDLAETYRLILHAFFED
ncbi:MAG: succinyl-diaminopimelate desuccinylase [Rhodospirillales bacterium]|jgi:succinyl-diaminopimelate desuccinylase